VLAQVAQRYLPGGAAWTGEISRFAMVWTTFFMAGYLLAHDQHIAIKVVDYFLPVRALGAVKLFGHALVAVTCLALVYATYDFMTHDRGQVTAAAEVPLSVIYAVVASGFASSALRAVVTILVQDLPELRTGEKGAA
jgi:TRAP-type C4-dicarboxylate transport system permease small subunit